MDATLQKQINKLFQQQQRNEEMRRLRWKEGKTLQEIADMFGLTRQRVQQITGRKNGKKAR